MEYGNVGCACKGRHGVLRLGVERLMPRKTIVVLPGKGKTSEE